MKYVVWTAVTDSGDGDHHFHMYKTRDELVTDLSLKIEYEGNNGGDGFDRYGLMVSFQREIFDMSGYEVVDA